MAGGTLHWMLSKLLYNVQILFYSKSENLILLQNSFAVGSIVSFPAFLEQYMKHFICCIDFKEKLLLVLHVVVSSFLF